MRTLFRLIAGTWFVLSMFVALVFWLLDKFYFSGFDDYVKRKSKRQVRK